MCIRDRYRSEEYGQEIGEILSRAEREGYRVSNWYSFDDTTVPGIVSVNNGGLKDIGTLDVLNPYDATLAERVGIDIAIDFVEFARKYRLPGLEECDLDRTGAAVGVRETRRVLGDYVPVSYTHLDVYKRQMARRGRLSPESV